MSRAVVYIPNGAMCCGCVHAHSLCNHLPFDKMNVIGSDASDPGVEYIIVRCSSYIKDTSKDDCEYLEKKGVEVR